MLADDNGSIRPRGAQGLVSLKHPGALEALKHTLDVLPNLEHSLETLPTCSFDGYRAAVLLYVAPLLWSSIRARRECAFFLWSSNSLSYCAVRRWSAALPRRLDTPPLQGRRVRRPLLIGRHGSCTSSPLPSRYHQRTLAYADHQKQLR